ncbi:MAG: hypothetical protein WAT37_16650 [Saprospiraceae bacterium]
MLNQRFYFFVFLLLMSNIAFGQLKGAVPQETAPAHINEERKTTSSTPTSAAKNNADKLRKSLKLSEKQYNDLYKALVEYETGVDKTTRSKLPKADQFKKMNELNLVRQNKLKTILTKEQYHAYIMSFP